MDKDYSVNIIKSYLYWDLYIADNQSYLGRCTLWCKRTNATDLTEATLEEQAEFFKILNNLKNVAQKVFNPDWFNYSFLGNEAKHLHMHFIPRYKGIRIFNQASFIDDNFGHHYNPNYDKRLTLASLFLIKDVYKNLLN